VSGPPHARQPAAALIGALTQFSKRFGKAVTVRGVLADRDLHAITSVRWNKEQTDLPMLWVW
jgi:hypothetical protein